MDPQTERLRTLFDTVAETYDQVGVDFFGPIAEGLVQALDPQPGERVLDLGCGRGAALLPAARAVGPTGRVVGGDLSPRMVDEARALARDAGLGHVEVHEMDAQEPEPPAAGDGYDVVCASLVLFFLPDAAGALRRWRDLTRPGGQVGISTFGPSSEAWRRIDNLFTPYLPPHLRDARTTGAEGPFGSDAGMEGLFRDAGLPDVRTETRQIPVRFESPDHWDRFSMSTGQRGLWMTVPEPERPHVRQEAHRILEAHAAGDGSVTFHQQARYTLARRPQAVDAAS